MKPTRLKKGMTFGDFIAAIYEVAGKRKAKLVVRFAVNTRQVSFLGPRRYVVA